MKTMKFIFLFIIIPMLLASMLIGCNDAKSPSTKDSSRQERILGDFNIVIIDSCEYLEYDNKASSSDFRVYSITHKGNCDNPIHQK